MSKVKYFIDQSWLLIVSSFLFGLMIAAANSAWTPQIEKNAQEKLNRAMSSLVTQARSFEKAVQGLQIPVQKGKPATTDIYMGVDESGRCAGFAFTASGFGFGGSINLIIGLDSSCQKFIGYSVISHTETPGFGDKICKAFFGDQFKGAPAEGLSVVKIGDPAKIDNDTSWRLSHTLRNRVPCSAKNRYRCCT